jgi:hypothetical protein
VWPNQGDAKGFAKPLLFPLQLRHFARVPRSWLIFLLTVSPTSMCIDWRREMLSLRSSSSIQLGPVVAIQKDGTVGSSMLADRMPDSKRETPLALP